MEFQKLLLSINLISGCHDTTNGNNTYNIVSFWITGTSYHLTLNESISSSDNGTTFTISTHRSWFRYPQLHADTLKFSVNTSAKSLTLTTGRDGDLIIYDVKGIGK